MKSANHVLKNSLKQFKEQLGNEFCHQANITHLTRKLAIYIDHLLIDLFHKNKLNSTNFCLLALGSYGRRELQLYSDTDLLLLHSEDTPKRELVKAQQFIRDCWDMGLEVGHQITTVRACAELASRDISVISSMLDMLHLSGSGKLQEQLRYEIHTLQIWPSTDYFFAKLQEQKNRHIKYAESAYNLEPNVKYGPGGLRDIHILQSISKRHFSINNLSEGISYGFITDKEYEELMSCQHFLWRVRFALHLLAGKAQERLSFDYQIKLANLFGYKDSPHSLAIEQFMKDYFKVTKRIHELNDMLLQWFNETIAHETTQKIVHLDHEFQLANQLIETRDPNVFTNSPTSILKLFHWLAIYPEIIGVRAATVRLVRESLFLIKHSLTDSSEAAELFIRIIKEATDPYIALNKMSEYGVLAHYLECFGTVMGQMQYDLFHVYTVDQHTLFVIRNLSRFKDAEYTNQFPLCARVIPAIQKPEILYLSALFHDIAKGRGGDHSELGAIEASHFADRHSLPEEDKALLVWLVQHHLIMSQTAQRQDIYDPKTIQNFYNLLPQPEYLDYLYLLTVADICGTNPALWNAWKDSLLKELYQATKRISRKKTEAEDEKEIINAKKLEASSLLIEKGYSENQVTSLWESFKNRYFLHESPQVIARHTKAILSASEFPLVMILPHHSQGGTEVLIYMPHRDERFTITTTVLTNHYVTIQESSIITCDNQFDLDTYIILNEKDQSLLNDSQARTLQKALGSSLAKKPLPKVAQRRISQALAHFNVATQIIYSEDAKNRYTQLFLITNDRPGLLATISRVFLAAKVHLYNAKIATAGERVEDMFYITNATGLILNEEEKHELKNRLICQLSQS